MPKRRAIELQIIPGRQVIEEITSEIAELGADSNIISLSLARSLGCKVTSKSGKMELIEMEPISIYGNTQILIRLPPTPGKTDKKFIKVEMKVIESLKTKIRIKNPLRFY